MLPPTYPRLRSKMTTDLTKLLLNYSMFSDWNISVIALDNLNLLVPIYLSKSPEEQKVNIGNVTINC